MEIKQGYSYHIKDEFFDRIQNKYLMSNKESGNYRPHFLAIQDSRNKKLYWMIPISSQIDKYKNIIKKKIKRYGKCNTIIIGTFAGKDNAFLIQNAFPIIGKYLDHVHTIEQKPITIHNKLNKELTVNLREVLALHRQGIHLIFPDIDYIQKEMEKELSE
ncbi:MAG: hypothetical protein NC355_08860 [Blautia sp.]|nr:hypothetical protein [Blautia sp.]